MRVAIVSAIGAVARKALRREGILKKVRIGVGADPPLVGDLKIPFSDIGERCGELQRPDFELNAYAPPLFLKRRANEASLLFRGTFQRQAHAHAVLFAAKARSFEKPFGASRIVGILRDVRFGGPVIRGQHSSRQLCLAAEQIADERFAVGRKSESLAKFAIRQDGIFKIEPEVTEIRAGMIADGEIKLPGENGNNVGRKRAHLKVGRAFAKFERTNDAIGDHSESHALDLRRVTEVFRIALEHNFFVLRLLNKAKRAGADGVARKVGAGVCRNDADGGGDETQDERSVRFAEVNDDRGRIRSFNGRYKTKGAALGRLVRRTS